VKRMVRMAAAGSIVLGSMTFAVAAGAQEATPTCQEDPAYCKEDVAGTDFNRTTTEPQTRVEGVTVTRGQELPVTGGDVMGLALIGAASVGAGVALTRASRRRRDDGSIA
jgi:hypothetical protein